MQPECVVQLRCPGLGSGHTVIVLLCAEACALPGNVAFHAGALEATLIQAFGYAVLYGVYDLAATLGSVEHRRVGAYCILSCTDHPALVVGAGSRPPLRSTVPAHVNDQQFKKYAPHDLRRFRKHKVFQLLGPIQPTGRCHRRFQLGHLGARSSKFVVLLPEPLLQVRRSRTAGQEWIAILLGT